MYLKTSFLQKEQFQCCCSGKPIASSCPRNSCRWDTWSGSCSCSTDHLKSFQWKPPGPGGYGYGCCGYVPPVWNCLTWLTKWQHQHGFSNTTSKHHHLKTGLSWTFHWQAEHARWWQGFVQPSHPGWTSPCSWQLLGEHQVNQNISLLLIIILISFDQLNQVNQVRQVLQVQASLLG